MVGAFGLGPGVCWLVLCGLAILLPIILLGVGRVSLAEQSASLRHTVQRVAEHLPAFATQREALRSIRVWSIALPFALALAAQVGFIVHLIAFLDPVIGRGGAATAVALLTAMAVVGRVLFSTVIDRLNQRLASAISFASQAVALAIIINFHNQIVLVAACGLFGFSVGNLITLPSLIVQREFDPRSFGVLVSLITAINQVTYAFGPGVIGLLRDLSGSYALPFYGCIGLQLIAAMLIMVRGRAKEEAPS